MIVTIASGMVDALQRHACADHPREACGLLFGSAGAITAAEPARNVATRSHHGFEIEPAALLRAYRKARADGHAVLGWYHSHPNGVAQPSVTDAARAVEDGKLWLIVTTDAVTAWTAVGDGTGAADVLHDRFAPVVLRAV